jgi:hypothetical protein
MAKPEGPQRWISTGETITLKGPFDLGKVPGQVVLPEGEHGIVGLSCNMYRRELNYRAHIVERGSILDGTGAVYERPIASFRVKAGEVSDIGSLQIATGRLPNAGFFGPRAGFVATAVPTPEPWLQNLAERSPQLYSARVVRPMIVPGEPRS